MTRPKVLAARAIFPETIERLAQHFEVEDNQADQVDRDFDEYEIESEWAGPRYQLVMRWSF